MQTAPHTKELLPSESTWGGDVLDFSQLVNLSAPGIELARHGREHRQGLLTHMVLDPFRVGVRRGGRDADADQEVADDAVTGAGAGSQGVTFVGEEDRAVALGGNQAVA